MMSADTLEIVAFERGSHTSYAACGLPYLIGGIVGTADALIARTPEQHRAKGINVRTRHEIIVIDPQAYSVTVRDLDRGLESVVHYDDLLIATGASGIAPTWPGIVACQQPIVFATASTIGWAVACELSRGYQTQPDGSFPAVPGCCPRPTVRAA